MKNRHFFTHLCFSATQGAIRPWKTPTLIKESLAVMFRRFLLKNIGPKIVDLRLKIWSFNTLVWGFSCLDFFQKKLFRLRIALSASFSFCFSGCAHCCLTTALRGITLSVSLTHFMHFLDFQHAVLSNLMKF